MYTQITNIWYLHGLCKEGEQISFGVKTSIHKVRLEDWKITLNSQLFPSNDSLFWWRPGWGGLECKEDRKNWWLRILKIVNGLINGTRMGQVTVLLCTWPAFLLDCHLCVSLSLRASCAIPQFLFQTCLWVICRKSSFGGSLLPGGDHLCS